MNRGAASHASAHTSSGTLNDAAAVALCGASLAFHKKPTLASPSASALSLSLSRSSPSPSHSRARDDGALTAALSVGNGAKHPSPSRAAIDPHSANRGASSSSGSSTPELPSPALPTGLVAARLRQLHPPSAKLDPKNPSFIAATLAASRSVSPNKVSAPRRKASTPPRKSSRDFAVDAGPIAPTGTLISLFDKPSSPRPDLMRNDTHRAQRMAVHRFMAAPPRTLPKPIRPPTPPPPVVRHRKPAVPAPIQPHSPPAAQPRRASPRARTDASRAIDLSAPATEPKTCSSLQAPVAAARSPTTSSCPTRPPKPRPAKPPVKPLVTGPRTPPLVVRYTPKVLSPKPVRLMTPALAPSSRTDAQTLSPRPSSSPSPDPQKRALGPKLKQQLPTLNPRVSQRLVASRPVSMNEPRRGSDSPIGLAKVSPDLGGAGANTSSPSVSSSPPKYSSPPLLPQRGRSLGGAPPSPPLDLTRRQPASASTSTLQLDSLANAIMAGSLASSRLTPQHTGASLSSPVSLQPPSGHSNRQRSPRMLQTLRQLPAPVAEESDHPRKGRRHKLRKGKHAHHEGSRKRWREEMTDRERKRYEAVWASNRGWLLQRPGEADGSRSRDDLGCVANVVVRDLWRRSRLPEDELAEVWELVDRGRQGMLTRPEFVVGMWLIDQRLRGRKLPHKVSDSLWGSANGLTVMKPKVRHA